MPSLAPWWGNLESYLLLYATYLVYVLRSLSQVETQINPGRLSARIGILAAFAFSFLIYASYTAVLTSTMTFTPVIEIRSFQDVIRGEYQTILMRNTHEHNLLKTAEPGTPLNYLYRSQIEGRPGVLYEDVEEVTAAMDANPKLLWYGSEFSAHNLRSPVLLDMDETRTEYVAFGLEKNSELREIFNFYILQLRQTGVIQVIAKFWFHIEVPDAPPLMSSYQLEYSHLFFLFSLLGFGIMLSFAFVCAEWMLNRQNTCCKLY